MKIQVVEDDLSLNQGIVLALKEDGFSFAQCNTVRQAKVSYGEGRPDIIVLDVNLPDGSGYDYLKWVRERENAANYTQVLILTANDMEMDEVISLSLGADDYVSKPFSLAVLRARIKNLGQRVSREAQKGENILDNAVKYSFDNSTIRVFVEEYGLYVSISVKNEGIGISEEESSKIFERFYRSEKVLREEGVGLGLYLAREILQRENGYIEVRSEEGNGAEFILYLWKG